MILHLRDLEPAPSGGGRIWLQIGTECFPEEGWYDLPGILLEYWRRDLRAFADGVTASCKLGFMDGPYCVRLHRKDGRVYASCMEHDRIVIDSVSVDFSAFWRRYRNNDTIKVGREQIPALPCQ